ncbi:ERC protein 2 [Channa argus]|uniref:ERC protein 2 n=1 Tax=Channa argus TaxID=215402 RepID=A0A6G1Q349_CHAAH|nr:ERC protein 2 [Channa argus]
MSKCAFASGYSKYQHVVHIPNSCPCRQQALLAAISEKDANIALLELSSSKRKKAQEEVMALKREKDRLMHQLKQQVIKY